MAMVNKSERSVSYDIPNMKYHSYSNTDMITQINTKASCYNSDIQSRIQSSSNNNNNKHPPFNSKCSRECLITNTSTVPGPGSYENMHSIMPKKSMNNCNSVHFFSNIPRFKSIDSNDTIIPGPGYYHIGGSFIDKKKLNALKKKKMRNKPTSAITIKYNNNITTNISTIPSKEHLYGYIFNEDGSLSVMEDPDKNDKFSGKKNDSVGPGQYEPFYKRDKNIMLSWDKMSNRGLKNENTVHSYNKSLDSVNKNSSINDSNTNVNNGSSFVNSIEYNNFKLKEKTKALINKKKIYKTLFSYRKRLLHFTNKQTAPQHDNTQHISNETLNNNYNNYSHNSIIALNKAPEHQHFGSTSLKGGSYIQYDKDIKAGPGSYFNYKDNSIILKQNKPIISNKIKHNILSKDKIASSLRGPGSYNLSGSFVKKSFSNLQGFSVGEKRFTDKQSCNINEPGPAEYSHQTEWITDNTKNDNKPKYIYYHNKIERVNENKQPDFNTYQNEKVINNIQSYIQSKENVIQSKIAPFMTMEKRFKINKENTHIGPGTYCGNVINSADKGMSYVFMSCGRKPNIGSVNDKENTQIGPGDYLKDNYFDWNKKSYNIMFV